MVLHVLTANIINPHANPHSITAPFPYSVALAQTDSPIISRPPKAYVADCKLNYSFLLLINQSIKQSISRLLHFNVFFTFPCLKHLFNKTEVCNSKLTSIPLITLCTDMNQTATPSFHFKYTQLPTTVCCLLLACNVLITKLHYSLLRSYKKISHKKSDSQACSCHTIPSSGRWDHLHQHQFVGLSSCMLSLRGQCPPCHVTCLAPATFSQATTHHI